MKNNRIPRSFRSSLIIASISILLIIASAYLYFYYQFSYRKAIRDIDAYADHIASHLSDVIRLPLYSFDYELLETICSVSMHFEMIEGIILLDEDNNIIFHDKKDDMPLSYTIEKIIDYEEANIGKLVLSITHQSAIESNIDHIYSFIMLLLVFIFMIGLFLSIILRRHLQRPLELFINNIERISEGRYEEMNLSRFKHRELHRIGERFNNMILQIKKRDNDLISRAKEIKSANHRLKNLMNTIPDGILLIDPSGNIIEKNKTIMDFIQDQNIYNISNILSIDTGSLPREKEVTLRNNMPVTLRTSEYKTGDDTFYLLVFTDISEQKKYQKTLEEERNKLAVTIRSIGDGIIATDSNGRIQLMNHIARDLTGYTEEEAIGRDIDQIFNIYDEASGKKLDNYVEKIIRLKEAGHIKSSRILISKDCRNIIINGTIAPIKDNNNIIIGSILVFRDITELKRIQDENRESSKLKSLGVLAGGIGHDFSNILTIILANISLLKMKTHKQESLLQFFDAMEDACDRADNLTKKLLSFSKGGELIKKETDIIPLIKRLIKMMTLEDTQINIFSESNIPKLFIDADQMVRVFQNIIINAVSAMPNYKKIDIIFDKYIPSHEDSILLKPGRYVKIAIKDYGTGIHKEDMEQIFDPYYTTKSDGTGLGLAIVYSIIKKHDGYIFVSSEPGKGSVFNVYLPY